MLPGHDPSTNLAILTALVDELGRHLETHELTRRVVYRLPTRRDAATLSLGVVVSLTDALLRDSERLSTNERALLAEQIERQTELRESRRHAYGVKLAREIKSHLDSWSWFLDDCSRGEPSCSEDYRDEVWLRTRVEQLIGHAELHDFDVAEGRRRAAELDEDLSSWLVPGPYIGPPGESGTYPRDEYWWLYGSPE